MLKKGPPKTKSHKNKDSQVCSFASETTYQDSFNNHLQKEGNSFAQFNQKVYLHRKKKFYQGKYLTKDTQGNSIEFRLFLDKDLKFQDIGGDDLNLQFDEDNQTDDETLQKFIKSGIEDLMQYIESMQTDGKQSDKQQKNAKNQSVKPTKVKSQGLKTSQESSSYCSSSSDQ